MIDYTIEQLDVLSPDIEQLVDKGHTADETKAGIACNYKKFSLIIKNSADEIVGVLTAFTAFAEVYLDDIWVKPDCRGKGLGRALLNELEKRFKGKGYNNINLVTSGFQAPEFYEKCGFEQEFVRVNKINPQLSKTFFVKYFDDEEQTQGTLIKESNSSD